MKSQHSKNVIKLTLADSYSEEKLLFAIQSNLEDYRLAYFINTNLQLQLSKERKEIALSSKTTESQFCHYTCVDEENSLIWRLIGNHSTVSQKKEGLVISNDLFSQTEEKVALTSFLIPELKRFDYLFIIEDCDDFFDTESITTALENIPQVSAVYEAEWNFIKKEHTERLYF